MKKFNIPSFYRSPIISKLKTIRRIDDPRKKDYSPTRLDFGSVVFLIARHFGFCYGVENAIEIAYKCIEENPDKNIFLLSEMIHNPDVNADLLQRGVKFLMDNDGNKLKTWNSLQSDDIVIIPAFGTTIEIEQILKEKKIDPYRYNTTCPFVEKVWNRAATIGNENFTIVIHGKSKHEETRATFSHSVRNAPSVIVRDIEETRKLASFILNEENEGDFYNEFAGKFSEGFDVKKDLMKVGVVNQTTMLASETELIADHLKETMIKKFGGEKIKEHFADTRDTLCYATNDNQNATLGLLNEQSDFAIVVGGYNSSNTTHIVELCEKSLPTYFISSKEKILSRESIMHFDIHKKEEIVTENFLPQKTKPTITLTSGASCPDSVVDEVLQKLLSYFSPHKTIEEILQELTITKI